MNKRLVTYLHGVIAGYFIDQGDGKIGFAYSADWVTRWRAGAAHQISVSLPVVDPEITQDATAYVAGLLPDSVRHRDLIAQEMGIGDDPSDFAFLTKMGRDSAGALMIIPEDHPVQHPGERRVEWLSEADLAEHLRSLPRRPLLIDPEHGVVLSLAGVNDKAAVVLRDGKIGLPMNGYPSTHIIKVDIPGLEDSIKTEYFCLQLAKAVGLKVPGCRLQTAQDQSFMLMQRYDRVLSKGRLERIHQEDFCQALDVKPGKKYQRYGGPGWAECFDLLRVTANPTESRSKLLKEAVFQFLTGNPDAHAKNYSLTYRRGSGAIDLSPLYDLNNAAAFKGKFKSAKPLMAMFIGDKSDRDQVAPADWATFARDCSIRYQVVVDTLTSMSQNLIEVLADVQQACPDCPAIALAVEDIRARCEIWRDMDYRPRTSAPREDEQDDPRP